MTHGAQAADTLDAVGTIGAAREAQRALLRATPQQLAFAVTNMAQALRLKIDAVATANEADLTRARQHGLSDKLVARLGFGVAKAARRAAVLDEIARLPSPLGRVSDSRVLPNGLRAGKMRCPIGVIAMVYEARPHVTLNAGALCLRTGNAVILKGGSEVRNTNCVLGELWALALEQSGLSAATVQVVTVSGKEFVSSLLAAPTRVDLVIPRGGKELIAAVTEASRAPVIKHFEGNCHVYVDAGADVPQAVAVCADGKLLMPEVCNATESVLVAADVADDFLPPFASAMQDHGVEIRGCREMLSRIPAATAATERDWAKEYLDLIVSVKVVGDLDEAIDHINRYGSHHTDAIVSPRQAHIARFVNEVDSGVVLSNASTMFCDGNTLGMGAEIGISTDKLHARGPMGMEELTTYKWVIEGNGHTMGDFGRVDEVAT